MLQPLLGRLLCTLHAFIHWQEKYKKRATHTHRATTQYFGDELRLFMAKAQDSGSHFTEMKSEGVRRRRRRNKKRRM
ncbi:hypothetical protein ACGGYM_000791 [Salmonella enterica]|nr:hypothetical protein [Salmonella enterica]EAW1163215.1 hypothetical protein [Salmonella enterica subsp. enterica]EAW1318806.1 hypothetical protein [Salmonella enterica subsp. diarizonae]ECS6416106.1 hypothetical protein [Salmonella enterica subsp. diarizonae serovar 50:r:z]EAN1665494.1 hypothetical protein [Salmonella enterica]